MDVAQDLDELVCTARTRELVTTHCFYKWSAIYGDATMDREDARASPDPAVKAECAEKLAQLKRGTAFYDLEQ